MYSYYEISGFCPRQPVFVRGMTMVPDLRGTALFLDFDGTLVEIAERPDLVRVDHGLCATLRALYERTRGAMAIVSGRQLSELEHFLPWFEGTLIGSHGAESRSGTQYRTVPEAGSETLAMFKDVVRSWARHHRDVLYEEKPASLALHFRRAPELQGECGRLLAALTDQTGAFVVHQTKMAFELMPARVSKRRALAELMTLWPGRMPIAIGDASTDEGMFHEAQAQDGYGIKVGEGDTAASVRVAQVDDVHRMLRRWLTQPPGTPGVADPRGVAAGA